MTTFGQQLREAMGSLTQDQLAAKTGIHQTTISRHLLGKARPRLDHVDTYERALPRLRAIRNRARRKATNGGSDLPQASGL